MLDVTLKFKNIFRGLERAYGQMLPSIERNDKGKIKVKRIWTETPNNPKKTFVPLTDKTWEAHLSGIVGIGIIPVTDEGLCKWVCIDIDPDHYIEENINHLKLVKDFEKMKLPFVVCSSKSGGAHLLLITKEFVSAKEMILKLQGIKAALGLPKKTEVFPKQPKLFSEKDDGSWLNLPYFKSSERKAFKRDGTRATLEEFLEICNSNALSTEEFKAVDQNNVSTLSTKKIDKLKNQDFLGAPVCLELITMKGKVKQNRNLFCKALTVYLKKRFPEEKIWQEKLYKYVEKYVDISEDKADFMKEISSMAKSYSGKDYDYKCDDPPICDHCEPVKCSSRKYGKKLLTDLESIIISCRILTGDDPSFFITLNLPVGIKNVEFKSEDLETPSAFSNRVLKKCYYKLSFLDKTEFITVLNNRLERARRDAIAPELTQEGRFKEIVEIFFARTPTDQLPLIKSNKIYSSEEEPHLRIFQMETLRTFLTKRDFKSSESQLSELFGKFKIKKYKAKDCEDGRISIGGGQVRVWCYKVTPKQIEDKKSIIKDPINLNLDGEI